MSNVEDTIVVFTAKSPSRILGDGGSQAWVLEPIRARKCTWLICCQNQHNRQEYADATEPHGSAFLLGRISEIRRPTDPDDSGRWQIAISEYARINVPNLWDHGRNPVRYTTLGDLGISLQDIEWQTLPTARDAPPQTTRAHEPTPSEAEPLLTIAEAKKRLAVAFGVKPDAVEITIRG